ncbi:universal stress protein [Nakamurella sp. PAMC28650]|uniref:universal stress protein n=1 Tax=Nakamurella sp. PAMC28650 TaxID=2762325 RepID=UPI00164D3925|nr:universal stress protein [Nakamurella sp. PAMC28650]QNK79443.1 universal stress protein [Nakamurella sp. PAMC28650]
MSTDTARPIVVGIDGSSNSLAALRWALREGAATGAPVEVVHCWIPQTLSDLTFGSHHELRTASACMLQNETVAALADISASMDEGEWVPPVVTELSLHGNAPSMLVDRSANARLLVLGARQTAAMSDLFRGTVEANCRKHASCPVVTLDRHHVVTWYHPVRSAASVG